MKYKSVKLRSRDRLSDKNTGWHICIDDGYCAYSFYIPYSKSISRYSIQTMADTINENIRTAK